MIYLDNAATTMKKPECVRQAVYEAMGNMGIPEEEVIEYPLMHPG